MSYGALTAEDIEVLERVLAHYHGQPLKFMEIGTYHGNTSRGIRDYCAANGIALEYWGIESGTLCTPEKPFPEANFVVGESREVFFKLPDDFDIIFCDADHTFNAVALDILHYGPKVKPGGFMLFHDCAPHIQYKLDEPTRNYPEHKLFHNAVNDALKALKFPVELGYTNDTCAGYLPWHFIYEKFHPECVFGGMRAYQRVP